MGGPYNKDYSILGSILGSPYLGKLPYRSKRKLSEVGWVLEDCYLYGIRCWVRNYLPKDHRPAAFCLLFALRTKY